MASELRVNTINSRTGFGTITVSETGQDLVGITTIENLTAENTLVGAAASFTGNVSVGGVLTYEDVTNIDAVGLITARSGIEIGARPGVGASISADGNMIVSGISTFGGRVLLGATTEGDVNADDLTIATTGNTGITIRSGTTSYGSIYFSDATSGAGEYDSWMQYLHGTGLLTFGTAGSTALNIDSTGRFGLKTSSISSYNGSADDVVIDNGAADVGVTLDSETQCSLCFTDSAKTGWDGWIKYVHSDNHLEIGAGAAERLRIDSSGRLLAGTTAGWGSDVKLHLANAGNTYLVLSSGTGNNGVLAFSDDGSERGAIDYDHNGDHMHIKTAAAERLRIDSGGRLLVGHTSSIGNMGYGGSGIKAAPLQVVSADSTFNNGAALINYRDGSGSPAIPSILRLALSRSDTKGSNGIVLNNDTVGTIQFQGNDGANFRSVARIDANVDAAPGTDDMPGRLSFLTTADGAYSPTEAMRIDRRGLVSKPKHLGILVRRNGHLNGYNSGGDHGEELLFNYIETNESCDDAANYYDISTGKFTAPVTGYYLFNCAARASNASFTQAWMTKGGARLQWTDVTFATSALACSTHLIYMSAGQYAGYHPYSNGQNSVQILDDNNHTYFRVSLL